MSPDKQLVQGKYILGAITKVGDPRRKHEDRVFKGEIFRSEGDSLIVGIVADGGADAGGHAAQIAVDSVVQMIQNSRGYNIPEIIENAIKAANQAVYEDNRRNDADGLTTLVVSVIYRDRCFVGNVGDSRAYWVQGGEKGKMLKLTRDHSYYNIYGGDPNSDEGKILVNAIGKKDDVYIDFGFYIKGDWNADQALRLGLSGFPLKEGEAILLCSDGLIKNSPTGARYATDAEIINALRTEYETDTAAIKMVSAALGRRPDDNVSAVTIQYLSQKQQLNSVAAAPSMLFISLVFMGVIIMVMWVTAALMRGYLSPVVIISRPTFTSTVTPTVHVILTQTRRPTRTPSPTLTPEVSVTIKSPTPTVTKAPTQPSFTPTVNATQVLQDAFGEIDDQFKKSLKGNIAFNKPDQMKKAGIAIVELILNPSLSQAALATQLVTQSAFSTSTADPNVLIAPNGETVTVTTSQIEITPRMKAVLLPQDSEAFTVTAMHDNAEQVVSSVETTAWRWSVTAKKEGSQTLELVIYQLVKYDGKEFWHEVETYKADILVEVTPKEWFKSWWAATIGAITAIAAIIISFQSIWKWFEERKKKAAESEPPTPVRRIK